MSAPKHITVTHDYQPEPEYCARALEVLLKKPVHTEGSPRLATLKDTRGESGHDSRADKAIIPE